MTRAAQSDWLPPDDVTAHNGEPIDRTRDFFQPPPAEIGKVLTAHSTLVRGKEPYSLGGRLMIVLFAPALILAIGYLITGDGPQYGNTIGPLIPMAVVAVIAFAVGWYYTGFSQTCSYVGEEGLARYVLKGPKATTPVTPEVFPFQQASELRTAQTRNFYNGVYTGTTYHFTWTDPTGSKRFKLSGNYRSKEGTPKKDDKFWLGRSAEGAWNMRQSAALQKELEAKGYCQFNLGGGDFVRVGPGFFEFGMKGEVARINAEEIKTLNLSDGRFVIHSKDAKWFSRAGKFSFQYGKMANAQLFLYAMEKLSGFTFSQ